MIFFALDQTASHFLSQHWENEKKENLQGLGAVAAALDKERCCCVAGTAEEVQVLEVLARACKLHMRVSIRRGVDG